MFVRTAKRSMDDSQLGALYIIGQFLECLHVVIVNGGPFRPAQNRCSEETPFDNRLDFEYTIASCK